MVQVAGRIVWSRFRGATKRMNIQTGALVTAYQLLCVANKPSFPVACIPCIPLPSNRILFHRFFKFSLEPIPAVLTANINRVYLLICSWAGEREHQCFEEGLLWLALDLSTLGIWSCTVWKCSFGWLGRCRREAGIHWGLWEYLVASYCT